MKINVLADLFHCSEVNSFDKKLLALHTDQFHSPNFKYGAHGFKFFVYNCEVHCVYEEALSLDKEISTTKFYSFSIHAMIFEIVFREDLWQL